MERLPDLNRIANGATQPSADNDGFGLGLGLQKMDANESAAGRGFYP
jgi:hypothetical protein